MEMSFGRVIFFVFSTTVLSTHAFCPSLSIQGPSVNSCYFAIKSTQNYVRSQHFCSDYFDGKLVSITNDKDNLKIMLLGRETLRDMINNYGYSNYLWLGGSWDGTTVTWDDGTSSSYTNFASNSPSSGQLYMYLNDGTWDTQSYSQNAYAMCSAKNTTSKSYCPKMAVTNSLSDSCYFPVDLSLSYQQAQHFCTDYFNANLASIQNAFDNQAVVKVTRDVLSVAGDTSSSIWIGGLYNGTTVLWEDGSAPTWVNWDQRNRQTQWYNVYLNLRDATWSTNSFSNGQPFVCKGRNGTTLGL